MALSVDILTYVLRCLNLRDLANWARTSHGNYMLVRWELRSRHQRMLSTFVGNTDGLLDKLRRCEGVISGSFALNYLTGQTNWVAADLDIYVPHDKWTAMCEYLIKAEGYKADVKAELEVERRRVALRKEREDLFGIQYPGLADEDNSDGSTNTDEDSDEDDEDWYKFDDNKVSIFPKDKLTTLDGGGEDSSAYVLLYKTKPLA